jgi:hypothetical protein
MSTIIVPNSPCRVLIIRMVSNIDDRYNSEQELVYPQCRVLVNVKTTYYFQPSSHNMFYTLLPVTTLLMTEIEKNCHVYGGGGA